MTKHDTYRLTLDGNYIGEFNSFEEAKEREKELGYTYQARIEPKYNSIISRPKLIRSKNG